MSVAPSVCNAILGDSTGVVVAGAYIIRQMCLFFILYKWIGFNLVWYLEVLVNGRRRAAASTAR